MSQDTEKATKRLCGINGDVYKMCSFLNLKKKCREWLLVLSCSLLSISWFIDLLYKEIL